MKNKIKKYIQSKLGILQLSKDINDEKRLLNEILKSQKFHDSILESEWLKYKSFSPGRGAVDYSVLYSMYKIIDIMRPKSILECGLGQSSKIIHQYAAFHSNVDVVTGEHDLQWVSFFKQTINQDKYKMNIQMLDMIEATYNDKLVLTYSDVIKHFGSKKYDFIIIDGPYGFGQYYYSRPQVLELVDCLANDFCILFDDYNREGEKHTVNELFGLLNKKGIDFTYEIIEGEKDHILICSRSWDFITKI